ncbi:MAG: transposase, partial [Exiguobacterium sp.]|nr:transposase [Exiguobacterium sp.]
MRATNSYKQLRENLLSLNLNQMALHLDEVLDFGIQSGASLTEVLVKLTNHEIDIQEQQKTHRMIRSA